jgi:hypothetical protein
VPIYSALWLARTLLGTPVPEGVLRELAPGAWRRRRLERALLGNGNALPLGELGGRTKLALQLLLLDWPWRLPLIALRTLFPEGDWLRWRYGLGEGRRVWRQRLMHPLRFLANAGP